MDAYLPIEGTEQAVHVQLRQGDITRQNADAIINFRPSWLREHASGKLKMSTPDLFIWHLPLKCLCNVRNI